MHDFEKTSLWTRSLAPQEGSDPASAARERLRSAFLLFRERASFVAGEIAASLPDFTVHDVTHLDALWEMADLIAGPGYPITPAEAFVLGGAFLIHDLGMGLAAYPGGRPELMQQPEFADALALHLKTSLGRLPTEEERSNPPPEVVSHAIAETLRALHAKQASRLTLLSWSDLHGAEQHLLEDPEIRSLFGGIIGLLGSSHWWAVARLAREFSVILGAPYWCPNDWTVDPLKVACLLRTADASHIDARRAPAFLGALRKPAEDARPHWAFQEKLHKPQLIAGRLAYTSAAAFPVAEAAAWWTCQETIEMIDRELGQVDALLADTNRPRFAAVGVSAAGDPERLVRLVPTSGWTPVDTRIRIGNIPALVKRLGGEQLYGDDRTVALRELIQNAADAVRARRIVEDRPIHWGEVTVRLSKESSDYWLEVEDNGIGMSSEAITGALLNFGESYWDSGLARQEHPGLHAKGFSSTGRFGIGFFSVFMNADVVQVISRRPDDGKTDTRVLEFTSGLDSRPILRPASLEEQRNEPGTIVRVLLRESAREWPRILSNLPTPWKLRDLCAWLAPTTDVTIVVSEPMSDPSVAVTSNDWKTLDSDALLRRVFDRRYTPSLPRKPISCSVLVRELKSKSGALLGRACILPEHRRWGSNVLAPAGDIGVVVVGGMRSSALLGIGGVLLGDTIRASRNQALPTIPLQEIQRWASEQAELVPSVYENPIEQLACAQVICALGADTHGLPVAFGHAGFLSVADVRELARQKRSIRLIHSEHGPPSDVRVGQYRVAEDVIAVSRTRPGLLFEKGIAQADARNPK